MFVLFSLTSCSMLSDDDIVRGPYNINGAIQKGPFVQSSNITIQPLNQKLKPVGQTFTTLTIDDSGVFELDDVNSKYVEIIATGYYFDEVEGKISDGPLTLRAIADLKEGKQTNVNLLTSLTYNRIKHLVTNANKSILEATQQAEKELYDVLGIPAEMQPNVGCETMNISQVGDANGLLLAVSAVLQEGRSVGELTEYIAKFSTDFANDGQVENTILERFNLDGGHLFDFKDSVSTNLTNRYLSLGIECEIPEFEKYLSYFDNANKYCIIPFTYDEKFDFRWHGFEDELVFKADTEYLGYKCDAGKGEIYLAGTPKVINTCQLASILTIKLPYSVTVIGEEAFMNNLSLRQIDLPEGLTSIGNKAFANCNNLSVVELPQSVTSIGEGTFGGCIYLMGINIPNGITVIPNRAFQICENIQTITLHDGITSVGDYAFYGCATLTEITLPKNLASIGRYAFRDCIKLKSVTIPDSVTSIGESAFTSCLNLAEFKGKYASADGRYIEVDGTLNSFAPAGVTEYSIPNTINAIGTYAFAACPNIMSITIPESVKSIGVCAFSQCRELSNVILSEGVATIKDSAFYGCGSLTTITIPESVTAIEPFAFEACKNLSEVYCPSINPPTASIRWAEEPWRAFNDNALGRKIYVPAASVEAYKVAEGWKEYANHIVGYDFK